MTLDSITAMADAGRGRVWRSLSDSPPFTDPQIFPFHGLGVLVLGLLAIATAYLIRSRPKTREVEKISLRQANAVNTPLDAIVAADVNGRIVDFNIAAARPCELPSGPMALKILLVEDDRTSRMVAREMLSRFGCRVMEATDGLEAIRAAGEQRFDLILMDVNMPNLGGLEATQAIRDAPQAASRKTPIVGLTAHALPEEQERLRQSGMQDCLIKPIRVRNLQALLRRFTDLPSEFEGAGSPAHDAPAGRAAIDHDTVDDLASLLPPKLFRERLEAFRTEVRGIDTALRATRGDQGPQAVGRLAHRYAGAAAMFGAAPLREHLTRIETAALASQCATLDTLLTDVAAHAADTMAALDKRSSAVETTH